MKEGKKKNERKKEGKKERRKERRKEKMKEGRKEGRKEGKKDRKKERHYKFVNSKDSGPTRWKNWLYPRWPRRSNHTNLLPAQPVAPGEWPNWAPPKLEFERWLFQVNFETHHGQKSGVLGAKWGTTDGLQRVCVQKTDSSGSTFLMPQF